MFNPFFFPCFLAIIAATPFTMGGASGAPVSVGMVVDNRVGGLMYPEVSFIRGAFASRFGVNESWVTVSAAPSGVSGVNVGVVVEGLGVGDELRAWMLVDLKLVGLVGELKAVVGLEVSRVEVSLVGSGVVWGQDVGRSGASQNGGGLWVVFVFVLLFLATLPVLMFYTPGCGGARRVAVTPRSEREALYTRLRGLGVAGAGDF